MTPPSGLVTQCALVTAHIRDTRVAAQKWKLGSPRCVVCSEAMAGYGSVAGWPPTTVTPTPPSSVPGATCADATPVPVARVMARTAAATILLRLVRVMDTGSFPTQGMACQG